MRRQQQQSTDNLSFIQSRAGRCATRAMLGATWISHSTTKARGYYTNKSHVRSNRREYCQYVSYSIAKGEIYYA